MAGGDPYVCGTAHAGSHAYEQDSSSCAKRRKPGGAAILQGDPAPARPVISAEEFKRLAAEGHNRIPVVREVLSDLDTPLSVYLKLADGPHTYLFESVEGGETWGRYSIIGLPARRTYTFRGHTRKCANTAS